MQCPFKHDLEILLLGNDHGLGPNKFQMKLYAQTHPNQLDEPKTVLKCSDYSCKHITPALICHGLKTNAIKSKRPPHELR